MIYIDAGVQNVLWKSFYVGYIYLLISAYWFKGYKLKTYCLNFHHPVECYFVINRYILLDLGHFVSFAVVLYKLALAGSFCKTFFCLYRWTIEGTINVCFAIFHPSNNHRKMINGRIHNKFCAEISAFLECKKNQSSIA